MFQRQKTKDVGLQVEKSQECIYTHTIHPSIRLSEAHQDFYAILGVENTASEAELRSAPWTQRRYKRNQLEPEGFMIPK